MPAPSELRLLVLGNSGDLLDFGPQLGTRLARLQQALAGITQRPVEAQFAPSFPTDGLSQHVARLLDEIDPDVVVLHCSYHAVATTSLRLYLETALGGRFASLVRRGVPVLHRLLVSAPTDGEAGTGLCLRRALYYAGRNALLSAGLGRRLLSVDAAAAAYGDAIALLTAHEAITVVVRGSIPQPLPHFPDRLNSEALERMVALDKRIATICAHRRVPFCSPMERMCRDLPRYLLPDGLHANAAGQALTLQLEIDLLRRLLE